MLVRRYGLAAVVLPLVFGWVRLQGERAQAEGAYQQIMDHSMDVICTFDIEGQFLTVNRACKALWGYLPEELIGRDDPSRRSGEKH
jgi:PAS domain-containing protein